MSEFRLWIKRKLCRHLSPLHYEEVLNRDEERGRYSWSAFYECPECGEVMGVEASFYGDPHQVSQAIKEALS